jgi:hypothetical protein
MIGFLKIGGSGIGTILLGAAAVAAIAFPAAAQSQQSETVQKLVDELRGIVARGEQRRLADPRFLDELKALAGKYDWPWQRVVFRERFRDGDYSHDPAWSVAVGRFWVDGQLGLRSRVPPFTRKEPEKKSQQQTDTASDLFGTVLRELTRPKNSARQDSPLQPVRTTPSEIFIPQAIGDAFAVRLRLRTISNLPARIEFGPYRGDRRKEGYRLVYKNREGSGPAFELVRMQPWGSSVVFALDGAPRLDDGRTHRILWTRDRAGNMKVRLDGKSLLNAADRGVRGAFQGLTIVNGSGDYGIAAVTVSDIPPVRRPRR